MKPASDDSVFKTRLKELVAIGKKKKGVLEYKEIMDHLGDVELDADQIEKVYEFFEGQGIDVLGIVDMEEEVEKMKIALIAHDKKKGDMIDLAVKYRDVLDGKELFATGTTGTMVMGETGLKITRMKSGPLGGDQQIGSMIAEGNMDMVIFLRDPLTAQPHEPDVSALLRLCDVQSIPLATNVRSAEIMLSALRDQAL